MKRKLVAALVVLTVLLGGTGCVSLVGALAGGGGQSEAESVSYPALSFSVAGTVSSVAQPVPAASSASQSENKAYVGVYRSTGDYSVEYTPRFVLRADGTFAGVANLLEAMGFCEGTYTVSGSTISVHITEADYFSPGVANSHDQGWSIGAEYVTLEIVDSDTIRATEPTFFLGGIYSDTIYKRSGSESDVYPVDTGIAIGGAGLDLSLGIVEADGGLNLRTGPGTGYESVALIPNGDYVEIMDVIGDGGPSEKWLYVRWNGKDGYVNSAYVLPADESMYSI